MTVVDFGPAREVLEEMAPIDHGHAIPLLQRIQETYGYLPREVVLALSEETAIPASHLFGLATFYAQFYLEEHGRHTVRVCRGTACHVRGRQLVQEAIDEELGIQPGETTADRRFSLETVACVGTCFLAPVVMVDHDYFGKVDPTKVGEIIGEYE